MPSARGRIRILTIARNGQVEILIQDDGPGIAPEHLGKMFTPFFTTKEVGKGTGLGLSLCYGILQEHGGTITVESKHGNGATFTLTLPALHETTAVAPVVTGPTAPLPPGCGTGKRVLVIDDEEGIVYLARAVLLEGGFEVDTALDGEAGLRLAQANDFTLIFCDWKMPGLTGRQVYEELVRTHPERAARMVFMTGDVVNETTQQFLAATGRDCLAKPFSVAQFQAAALKLVNTGR